MHGGWGLRDGKTRADSDRAGTIDRSDPRAQRIQFSLRRRGGRALLSRTARYVGGRDTLCVEKIEATAAGRRRLTRPRQDPMLRSHLAAPSAVPPPLPARSPVPRESPGARLRARPCTGARARPAAPPSSI